MFFYFKAIEMTQEQDESRIQKLVQNIRIVVYQWISRGLFEKHKQIFLTLMSFRLLQKGVIKTEWTPKMMNFLLNCVPKTEAPNNLKDWLPNQAWFCL